jgi:DNA adenine methylase
VKPLVEPPIKWHGGKYYLRDRIIALMPPRAKKPNAPAPTDPGWLHYVEAFAGGLQVLLANDPTGISEVANDISSELMNFWKVLQDEEAFARFYRIVEAVPFSEAEFQHVDARFASANPVQRAVGFFVQVRQSLAGRRDSFAPLSRNRTRRGMSEQVSAWIGSVEGLPAVHARLRQVAIRNRPAISVIRAEDGPRTLHYCDPPYLKSTRTARDVYQFEMTEAEHVALLQVLLECRGKVMLSGYRSELYDSMLAGWNRHEFEIANHASGNVAKRTMVECVWTNFQEAQ